MSRLVFLRRAVLLTFVLLTALPTFALAAPSPSDSSCLLYTSDAADERSSVDLGGRRIIKKKKKKKTGERKKKKKNTNHNNKKIR